MSKSPHLGDMDSLPPPSYTEATGSTIGPSRGSTTSTSSVSGPSAGLAPAPIPIRTNESPLTTHLRTLPSRLRSAQHSHSTTQSSRETFLVSQCVPHIEWFIEDIVNLPKTPQVAELVLVPTEGLPGTESSMGPRYETSAGRELARKRAGREDKGWEMAGVNEKREDGDGEVVRVGCVSALSVQENREVAVDEKWRAVPVDEKGRPVDMDRKDSGSATRSATENYTFGEWGRFETEPSTSSSSSSLSKSTSQLGPNEAWNWFTTPILARRIASLLRPEPTLARKTVQAAVEAPKAPTSSSTGTKKSGFGSFFRRSSAFKSDSQGQTPTERVMTPVRDGAMLEEERIAMAVRAEEVTFRRENEFGVWESLSGWVVVVSIKVGRL